MKIGGSRIVGLESIAVLGVVLLVYPFSARANAQDAGRTGALAAENAQRGQHVFETNCAFCHGGTAKGSSNGPSLIDSSLVRHDSDGDLIGATVRAGRSEKGMPAFPNLTSQQTSDLAAFLHARILVTDSVETAGPAGGYQLKHLLSGDAGAGERYFRGPGGCLKCHSATGDLAGIAHKYQPVELETHFLRPPAQLAVATITLPSGQKIQGKLVHLDEFYVGITDAEGHYHSWSLPGPKVVVADPLQPHLTLLGKYSDKDMHDVFAYLETLK